MLLDKYMELFDFNEIHRVGIDVPRDRSLYENARHLDFRSSFLIKSLFFLRGLGTKNLTLDSILRNTEFSILEEDTEREFVIGAMADSALKPVPIESPSHFTDFDEADGIKITWSFTMHDGTDGGSVVSTETRILCLGPKVKRRFSIYWFFVAPFSGLVRLEMLRVLKKQSLAARKKIGRV